MARRIRIHYPGALYHVVNRGNYRRTLFETAGAAAAFVSTIEEASAIFAWKVFAYALMRNHFHLVIETQEANLVESMHWLQCTYSTRFNRFRSERGHLFQGRYHAGLIENPTILSHIVDYVHLNPVRAGIVDATRASQFRWSSLNRYVRGSRFPALTAREWLEIHGLQDDAPGWGSYQGKLVQLAHNLEEQKRLGWSGFSYGWAHGSESWRKALARDQQQHALNSGIESGQLKELKEQRWRFLLEDSLLKHGRTSTQLLDGKKGASWKLILANELRVKHGIPIVWLSEHLRLGTPGSARSLLCRLNRTCREIAS